MEWNLIASWKNSFAVSSILKNLISSNTHKYSAKFQIYHTGWKWTLGLFIAI